jgi:hypothetical protein
VEWSALGGSIEIGERVPHEENGERGFLVEATHVHAIEGLSNVSAIVVGGTHSLAIERDGTVVQWQPGDNVNAGTRISMAASPPAPNGLVTIGGHILSNVVSVAAGSPIGDSGRPVKRASLALDRHGTVAAWGNIDRLHAATVPDGLSNVVAIAAGPNFCLAITTNEAFGK